LVSGIKGAILLSDVMGVKDVAGTETPRRYWDLSSSKRVGIDQSI
jgi:hypothetical protein